MSDVDSVPPPLTPEQLAAEMKAAEKAASRIFTNRDEAEKAAESVAGAVVQLKAKTDGTPQFAVTMPGRPAKKILEQAQPRAGGGYVGGMENSRMRPQGYRGGGMATRGYGRVRD
jgi:hypothetical protein